MILAVEDLKVVLVLCIPPNKWNEKVTLLKMRPSRIGFFLPLHLLNILFSPNEKWSVVSCVFCDL